MCDTEEKRNQYVELVYEVLRNAVYIFLIIIACKLLSALFYLIHHKSSSFDVALKVLLHYGEYSGSILSFFTVGIMLISFTLAFEPAVLTVPIRNYLAVPALKVAGHMLSLSVGATAAWFVIDAYENTFELKNSAFTILFCFIVLIFSWLCQAADIFFKKDYMRLKQEHGKVVNYISMVVGVFVTILFYYDYVYKFVNPTGH